MKYFLHTGACRLFALPALDRCRQRLVIVDPNPQAIRRAAHLGGGL
jgi:hypothetical protein